MARNMAACVVLSCLSFAVLLLCVASATEMSPEERLINQYGHLASVPSTMPRDWGENLTNEELRRATWSLVQQQQQHNENNEKENEKAIEKADETQSSSCECPQSHFLYSLNEDGDHHHQAIAKPKQNNNPTRDHKHHRWQRTSHIPYRSILPNKNSPRVRLQAYADNPSLLTQLHDMFRCPCSSSSSASPPSPTPTPSSSTSYSSSAGCQWCQSPWAITERSILISLFNATIGWRWKINLNWLTQTPVCDWHGITCDPITHRVITVNLDSNNLVGTVPANLVYLSSLQSLLLGGNGIVALASPSSLPLPWSNFTSLRHLDLSFGNIPALPDDIFGFMPALQKLQLHNMNNLEELPLSVSMLSSSLSYLDISYGLVSAFPPNFSRLASPVAGGILSTLNISNTFILDLDAVCGVQNSSLRTLSWFSAAVMAFPLSVINCTSLTWMELSVQVFDPSVAVFPPQMSLLTNLEVLFFSFLFPTNNWPPPLPRLKRMQLTFFGQPDDSFGYFYPALEVLALSDFMGPSLPDSLCALSNLSMISFQGAGGNLPDCFGSLSKLHDVTISFQFMDRLPATISNLSRLQFLTLQSSLPLNISAAANLRSLTYLAITITPTLALPDGFGSGLHSLRAVVLGGFLFHSLPESLWCSPTMVYISVENGPLDTLPSHCLASTSLRELYLSYTSITSLVALPPSLQIVAATGSKLTSIGAALSNATNLGHIDFSSNQITYLPPTGYVPSLSYVILSNNAIRWLPWYLVALPAGQTLDISHNQVAIIEDCSIVPPPPLGPTGTVVEIIGHHNQLQSSYLLDPLNCLLSLRLPQLALLDFSYNNLSDTLYLINDMAVQSSPTGIGLRGSGGLFITNLLLSHNSFTAVSTTAMSNGRFNFLLSLDLSYNQLHEFQLGLPNMPRLQSLNLRGNPSLILPYNYDHDFRRYILPDNYTQTYFDSIGLRCQALIGDPSITPSLSINGDPQFMAFCPCACIDPWSYWKDTTGISDVCQMTHLDPDAPPDLKPYAADSFSMCVPCPAQLICDQKVAFPRHAVRPGYYPVLNQSFVSNSTLLPSAVFLQCRSTAQCNPTASTTYSCREGHDIHSLLCSRCVHSNSESSDSYFMVGQQCYRCDQNFKWLVPLVNSVLVMLYLCALWWWHKGLMSRQGRGMTNIVIAYLQVTVFLWYRGYLTDSVSPTASSSSPSSSPSPSSPFQPSSTSTNSQLSADSSSSWMAAGANNLVLLAPFGMSCVLPDMDFVGQFWLTVCIPVGLVVLVVIIRLVNIFGSRLLSWFKRNRTQTIITHEMEPIGSVWSVQEQARVPFLLGTMTSDGWGGPVSKAQRSEISRSRSRQRHRHRQNQSHVVGGVGGGVSDEHGQNQQQEEEEEEEEKNKHPNEDEDEDEDETETETEVGEDEEEDGEEEEEAVQQQAEKHLMMARSPSSVPSALLIARPSVSGPSPAEGDENVVFEPAVIHEHYIALESHAPFINGTINSNGSNSNSNNNSNNNSVDGGSSADSNSTRSNSTLNHDNNDTVAVAANTTTNHPRSFTVPHLRWETARQSRFNRRWMYVIYFSLNVLYLNIASQVLQIFNCTDVADANIYYLSAAPWIDCHSSKYYQLLAGAVVFFAVYVIGIPLLLVGELFRQRHRLDHRHVRERIGFLYTALQSRYFFWEAVVVLARKLTVVMALALFSADSIGAPIMVFIVLLASLVAQFLIYPYKSASDNRLEAALLILATVTYFASICAALGVGGSSRSVLLNIFEYLNFSVGATLLIVILLPSKLLKRWCARTKRACFA